jgi:hypothetical protein
MPADRTHLLSAWNATETACTPVLGALSAATVRTPASSAAITQRRAAVQHEFRQAMRHLRARTAAPPRHLDLARLVIGCHWIEGDDFAQRLEEIFCCAPVVRPSSPYCATHRARAYIAPGSPDHEAEPCSELTPLELRRYLELRRDGLTFDRAIDLASRPPAVLIRRLAA